MQALQFTEFGPPSVLKLIERPDPTASHELAVVRIKAASINPSDVKNVAGAMQGTVLPRVPGRDFSGIVTDGPAEWMGAEVWGTGGDVGFTVDGTHASHCVVPISALVKKPANLTHEQAASIGVNFVVAWLGAVTYGGVKEGETIAVVGVGGGVGGAVAQISKARGARVIGIGRTRPAEESPAAHSIDDFVSTENNDLDAQIRDLTDGNGADIVYDAVGGVMFEPALKSLAHRGRLIEIAATGKRRVEFDLADFYHHEHRIFGADSRKLDVAASAVLMAQLVAGFETGQYQPPLIAGSYALENAQAAYTAVAQGTSGRIVLTG